ncbi:enoyl-CoA hydratase/isomerase family protein [Orrella sp. NBD-18]|uniref:Enoyl-CoA hydratase/isomerase family protein n=1 Tax=Sheuella amnicola TaxID=2707330 RepID=A0A6B2R4K2_9BURK|nr:enoyl-CoA hydratase/isomerase family protein [Sheuella amnicola]NDY83957.1 enoyl-CoA hydratase/isomerase family protein [Sheuella amnicola]
METINFEVEDGVATLTLNRPQRKNAIDAVMREELKEVVFSLPRRRDLRALIITGAGGSFSAGGDISVMGQGTLTPEEGRDRMRHDYLSWIEAILRLEIPVIAAVDGPAFGAGFSLALTADIVLATPRSRFCLSFMRLGLVPDCAVFYTLPRIVGQQRAKELAFSARDFDAAEAQRMGIVLEVTPEGRVLERAQQMARCFANAAPAALAMTKRAFNVSMNSTLETMMDIEAAGQAVARTTQWHTDAVQRFLNKQPSAFQWPSKLD